VTFSSKLADYLLSYSSQIIVPSTLTQWGPLEHALTKSYAMTHSVNTRQPDIILLNNPDTTYHTPRENEFHWDHLTQCTSTHSA
jgi:hypothetical protein